MEEKRTFISRKPTSEQIDPGSLSGMNKKRLFLIIGIILAVLIVGSAAGWMAFKFFWPKPSVPEIEEKVPSRIEEKIPEIFQVEEGVCELTFSVPTPTPTPTPTPPPGCWEPCTPGETTCESGMVCAEASDGQDRCLADTDECASTEQTSSCQCPAPTATPTPTPTSTPTPTPTSPPPPGCWDICTPGETVCESDLICAEASDGQDRCLMDTDECDSTEQTQTCQCPSPTATPTTTPTPTATPTATPTPTSPPGATSTPTPTLPPGVTPTATPVYIAEATPTSPPSAVELPEAGIISPTILVTLGGIILVILGLIL